MTPTPPLPVSATRKCLRFGWWSLLCWLALGMVLEVLHGFKIGWYLDVANEARRLQWRLAHTHGTLIALVNLAFAATLRGNIPGAQHVLDRAGACLRWAGMVMPVGFLLGGLFTLGADPGFAIVLVPIGGLLLFVGVLLSARTLAAAGDASDPGAPRTESKGRKRDP